MKSGVGWIWSQFADPLALFQNELQDVLQFRACGVALFRHSFLNGTHTSKFL